MGRKYAQYIVCIAKLYANAVPLAGTPACGVDGDVLGTTFMNMDALSGGTSSSASGI